MYKINGLKQSLRLPVIGAPMFTISNPNLVISQCKSGIIGSFPALNAREPEDLDKWIREIKSALLDFEKNNPDKKAAPFAVNQICHKSNIRLYKDLETCVKHEVPIIISSVGAPNEIVDTVHSYGGKVFHDVINIKHAKKAADLGVDGLILVCAGAGGHGGTLSPFALLREVKEWFEGIIILSGAIADGYTIASSIALGADLVYIGSRFITTIEANANEVYKKMIVDSSAEDIVYTSYFSGIHGNYLKQSIINSGLDPDNLPIGDKKQTNFNRKEKPKTWKDIWGSGQGIGRINNITTVEKTVVEMEKEFNLAISDLDKKIKLV
jgi:nitronate monooxygenase